MGMARLIRQFSAGVFAALVLTSAPAVVAETRPTLNLYGVTGLIDTPSAESQPDGYLALNFGYFGPIRRNAVTFQITPRISGSFRYLGVQDWSRLFCPPDCTGINEFPTYYDRSFDLRYKLIDEGRYVPALTIGFQDFVGTGLQSAEYIVATKHITPQIKVTAGLGWGRLGTYNPIATPFGARPKADPVGNLVNTGLWFKGDVAPFGGIEWQINDRWGAKVEYSSDAYVEEVGVRETFERNSPVNFGIEFQRNASTRYGLYYMYGSEIGFNAQLIIDPAKRPMGGVAGPGPNPVMPRPSRASDPEAWATDWVTQADAKQILIENM